jgi:D-alanyl-D-alanine carboxypeptidase/D-alanyl-D-alanine-endopeptidase (penicillin-binding protein 4)
LCGVLLLAGAVASAAAADALPEPLQAALTRAQLPADSLALWVAPAGGTTARLSYRAQGLVNPASLMKLVTSAVALELLGPSYTWSTPVMLTGPLRAGVLQGDLVIEGRGDPKLVSERLWLLLRQVQQLGVRDIAGDIVLDRRAFQVPDVDPGRFDGEPYRPYNVQPDALMVNQKALLLTFRVQPSRGVAQLSVEPRLTGLDMPAEVPLSTSPCGDWRGELQADFSDPAKLQLRGRYPAACGDKTWPVAPAAPERYNARAIEAMWREMGGTLQGRVRDGARPAGQTGQTGQTGTTGSVTSLDFASPSLGEVLRDMNKYSNNVIAQQLFLTLALTQRGVGTLEAAREIVLQQTQARAGCAADELRVDNGSGLSREARISARCLGAVLQWAWASAWMPEYIASLPIAGENTARRAAAVTGRAHLKTGSLNNVAALAGYVEGSAGRRWAVVAILNHPRADSDDGRQVLNAVLRWTADDRDLNKDVKP